MRSRGQFALCLIIAHLSETRSNAESLDPIDMSESEVTETNLDDLESTSTNTWFRDRLLHELLLERHPLPNTDQLLLEDFLWSGTEGKAENEEDPSANSLSSSHFRPVAKTLSPEFLLRTILKSNLSIIDSDIKEFRQYMEQRLAKAYSIALQRRLGDKRETKRRIKRDEQNSINNEDINSNISTHVHNIRSTLPPESRVELIYSVHQDGKTVRASEAVSVLCELSVSDMESLLEQSVETRAELYTKSSSLSSMTMTKAARSVFNETTTGWMWVVVACLISILLLLTLLTLLVLVKRWRSPYTRSLLVGSPEHGSNNGGEEPRKDEKVEKKRDLEENYEIDFDLKGAPEAKQLEGANTVFQSNILTSMKSDKLEFNSEKHQVSPEVIPRRPKPNRRMRLKSTSNSAFPVRTTPATCLAPLREEFSDNNEANYGENHFNKDKKWPFVNRSNSSSSSSSSSSNVESSSSETLATQIAEMATQTEGKSNKEKATTTRIGRRKRANRIDPASFNGSRSRVNTRSTSATSVDVQADLEEEKKQRFLQNETRRHSSTTPVTPSSDPTFAMRQRHWEIFAQGKKQSHHGRLLPGSSTSEEENNNTINSDEDKTGNERPVIDAIKQELTKFDRPPRQNEDEEDQGPTEV